MQREMPNKLLFKTNLSLLSTQKNEIVFIVVFKFLGNLSMLQACCLSYCCPSQRYKTAARSSTV